MCMHVCVCVCLRVHVCVRVCVCRQWAQPVTEIIFLVYRWPHSSAGRWQVIFGGESNKNLGSDASSGCKGLNVYSMWVHLCVCVRCLHVGVWESVFITVCMLLRKNMHVRTPYCGCKPSDKLCYTAIYWQMCWYVSSLIKTISIRLCYHTILRMLLLFLKKKSTSKSDARKHISTNKKWKNTMPPKRKTQKQRVKVTEEWYHKYTVILFSYLDLWFVLCTYNTIHLCKKKRMVT